MTWLTARAVELWQWLLALEAPSAFLLALPFTVALAAFVGEGVRALWSVRARKS